MNDKELLELAARAAGHKYEWRPCGERDVLCVLVDGCWMPWDALLDCGDALRLAIRLRMDIRFEVDSKHGFYICADSTFTEHGAASESYNETGRNYTETCRAIVRAAAEIGKAMP